MKVTNLKHESSSVNNIVLNSDGSVGGELATTLASKLDATAPVGKVLQVVYADYATSTSTTSNAYSATGLTASITPSSATSKVLVLATHNSNERAAGSSNNNGLNIRLRRDGTTTLCVALTLGWTGGNFRIRPGAASFVVLDSPATTSSVTYATEFAANNSGDSVTVQLGNEKSTICLLEIAA